MNLKAVRTLSTLESTISILENMSPSDVAVLYTITKALFDKQVSCFQPLSCELILQDLVESRQQIQRGQYNSTKDALHIVKAKHAPYNRTQSPISCAHEHSCKKARMNP